MDSDHKHKKGYIYVLCRSRDYAVKVGLSREPLTRVRAMNAYPGNGDVFLCFQNAVLCMRCVEKKAHELLSNFRLPYDPDSGSTEWFSVEPMTAVDMVFAVSKEIGTAIIAARN